jgi:acyl-CoA dehydrogenase
MHMLLLWLVVLVIGLAWLAHRRVAAVPALGIVAVYLVAMGIFTHGHGWGHGHGFVRTTVLWVLWIALIAATAFVLLPDLRRTLFSARLFAWFRKTLPPMSVTEREAIDAGTVWWDGELFSGRPDWHRLLNYPKVQLSEEEQAFIDGPTEELCAMVSDWQIGQDLDLPPEAWAHIKAHGFFALIIPKEYGGKGFSAYAHSQVAMKLATRSGDRTAPALRHRGATQPLPTPPRPRR